MKKKLLVLLILAIAAQFAVIASLIAKHERVLRDGQVFLFKTRPIDPADPFQGRYVRLGFDSNYIPGTNEHEDRPQYKEQVYVTLATNAAGFCELTDWSRTKPTTDAYLKLRYSHPKQNWDQETRTSTYEGLIFTLPFDRFYMEEAKAPRAERQLRTATGNTNCWATVRILNGVGLIEDVYVNGTSIRTLTTQQGK